MDKYRKMIVKTLSPQEDNFYVVVLSDLEEYYFLGITVSGSEALNIASEMGNIEVRNEDTGSFMLIKDIFDLYDMKINKLHLNNIKEGVFDADLYVEKDDEENRIKVSIGIALSLCAHDDIPIYVSDDLLEEYGTKAEDIEFTERDDIEEDEVEIYFLDEEDHIKAFADGDEPPQNTEAKTLKLLNKKLEKAVEDEDYEKAARIRDEIDKIKNID